MPNFIHLFIYHNDYYTFLIEYRPEMVDERNQNTLWKCELVMFRREFGSANVTSQLERVSRFTVIMGNPDRQLKPVMESVIEGRKDGFPVSVTTA